MSTSDIALATVGNSRIRTAFHLDDGRRVYLELIGSRRTKYTEYSHPWFYTGFVDSCYAITDDTPNDDCNRHRIKVTPHAFEWSLAGILQVVNKIGASFDAVEIAPDYAGYRVFRETGMHGPRYNYGDEFTVDHELAAARAARVAELEEQHKAMFGLEYDDTSYWVDHRGKLVMRYNVSADKLSAAGITERKVDLE